MKTVFILLLFILFSKTGFATETKKSDKGGPSTEKWCIDVPYGNSNSSPEEINRVANAQISKMRSVGLTPLPGEQPTITKWEDSSEICIRAKTNQQPVELF